MSFDDRIYNAPPGTEKESSASALHGLPLGARMRIDEREYIHARIGGTAMAAGRVYASGSAHAGVADTMLNKSLVPAADYAIGATTVAFTTGGTTAITTNMLKDGYLSIASSTGTGIGWMYKIKSNNSAAAASATCTLVLYETDPIKVATNAATSTFGVVQHPFSEVEAALASSVGHLIAGVSCATAAASSYVWLQRKGPAVVLSGGTVLRDKDPVVCSTAAAGAVVPVTVAATTSLLNAKEGYSFIGYGMAGAAATGYSVVYLTLA